MVLSFALIPRPSIQILALLKRIDSNVLSFGGYKLSQHSPGYEVVSVFTNQEAL